MAEAAYLPWINRLRAFLIDYVETNPLIAKEENSDDSLQFAIEDAMEFIGKSYQPTLTYTVRDIRGTVPWFLVRDGAIINVLKSNLINSARNQHSYTDSGGVQERDLDTYGRYINILNIMESRWDAELRKFKAALNIEQGYGGVSSEFALHYEQNMDNIL